MCEIVKYHNDFNKIQLPSFTEQEQNLLFGILTKIKEKPAGENIKLTPQELLQFSTENLTNKALGNMLIVLRNKFFKADFTILIEDTERDLIGQETINLFQSFILWYHKSDIHRKNLLRIELQVNPRFEYLMNELTANFTRFELAEFIALSGKYTKTLYRLLKQYRNTGYMRTEWEEFVRIMDIPYTRQTDIDQFILKPAIKELAKPRNLFDIERVPFKNIQYRKIKKGGNKVVAIEFRFDIENLEQELLESNHFFDESFVAELKRAKGNFFSKNGEWLYINNAVCVDSKIILNLYNKDTNKNFNRTYTKDEYERDIKPFIVSGNMQKVF